MGAKFTNGRSEALQKYSSGRRISVTNEENTGIVAQILKKIQFTCEEIAHETGICHSSVHTILTERLGMRKIAARWVPHFLSKAEKEQRVEICSEHLHKYTIKGENMLKRIVATDETWIRSFEPELKRQMAHFKFTKTGKIPKKHEQSKNADDICLGC